MPFRLYNSSTIEYQKLHEYEYKKFLKTLQTNNNNNSINTSEEKLFKNRQINLQYRQNKRKLEYERIQKENLKFSQKLINAKTSFNRSEQQLSFDKHCQLKQRLQRYPDSIQTKNNKIKLSILII
jgi:L-rhamnose mutarotase